MNITLKEVFAIYIIRFHQQIRKSSFVLTSRCTKQRHQQVSSSVHPVRNIKIQSTRFRAQPHLSSSNLDCILYTPVVLRLLVCLFVYISNVYVYFPFRVLYLLGLDLGESALFTGYRTSCLWHETPIQRAARRSSGASLH